MNNILLLQFIIVIVITSWVVCYSYLIQMTTIWLTKRLLENNFLPIERSFKYSFNQLQAFITPRFQSIRQLILIPLSIIILLVESFVIHWYICLIGAIGVYILSMLIGALFYTKKVFHYVAIIQKDLYRKQLLFEKKEEFEKAVFIENLITYIQGECIYAKNNNLDINKV